MKKIVVVLMIFLLSGCSINYKLKINEDLTVEEDINVTTVASYFDPLGPAESVYKNTVDLGMKDKNYNYIYVNEKNNYGLNANRKFTSLDEFKTKATSYKELYDDIEIIKDGTKVIINSIGNLKVEKFLSTSEDSSSDDLNIHNSYISIEVPYKVLYSNADKISTQDNIYYWNIDNKTTKDKTVQISFDTSEKFISVKKILNNIGYTFFIIVAIILIVIISYNNMKHKHIGNNKI